MIRYLRDADSDQHRRYLDLEDVPYKVRRIVVHAVFSDAAHPFTLGAADLPPDWPVPADTVKVLLDMPETTYAARRLMRDETVPSKADQDPHWMVKWRAFRDLVPVDASKGVEDTAAQIRVLTSQSGATHDHKA
jgi:hypothetical protein